MLTQRYILLLLLLSLCSKSFGDESHYCLKFSVDSKSDFNFVTIQLGTPLVPYRLLICPEPKVKNMNFYQVVMLGSSFGSSINGGMSNRFFDQNSAMNIYTNNNQHLKKYSYVKDNYYSNYMSNVYSSSHSRREEVLNNIESFSKSVSFDILYSDQWSTIGKDYSRTIDGKWFEIGIEVSNLASIQKVFDSYCNPGGLGDSMISEIYNMEGGKYGNIDGFYLLSSGQNYLTANYDVNRNGYSTTIYNSNMLTHCFQDDQIKKSLLYNFDKKSPVNGILKTSVINGDEKYINLNNVDLQDTTITDNIDLYNIRDNTNKRSVEKNIHKHDTNFVKASKIPTVKGKIFKVPKFAIDSHVLDNPTKLLQYNSSKNQIFMNIVHKQEHEINMGYIPSIIKSHVNISNMINFNKNVILENKIKHINSKRIDKRNVQDQNIETGFQLNILLNQPYTYLPTDIYVEYLKSKNFVVDVPDQMWQKICLSKQSPDKQDFCLSPSFIIKPEYLSKTKNGYVEYFPKSLSSFAAHFYILNGGRLFGNTIVDRNQRSLKVTGDFEKVKSTYTTDIHEDGYYRYAISQLISNPNELIDESNMFKTHIKKRFVTNTEEIYSQESLSNDYLNSMRSKFGIQSNLLKANKLLLLPHFGSGNNVYIGTSAIFGNYGSIKLITDHKNLQTNVYTNTPTGLDYLFLPLNVDFDERSMILFFIVAFIYGVILVNSFYLLTETWKFSVIFSSYVYMKYKLEFLNQVTSSSPTLFPHKKEDNLMVSYMLKSFLDGSKKIIMYKDVLITNGCFLIALTWVFSFGSYSFIKLVETHESISILNNVISMSRSDVGTSYVENYSVFPQQSGETFFITTILCLIVMILSFIGYVLYLFLQFSSYMEKGNRESIIGNVSEYKNLVITGAYLPMVLENDKSDTEILVSLPANQAKKIQNETDMVMQNKTSKKVISVWDSHTEYKEHIMCFIFGQVNLVVFFASVLQFITISVESAFLLRMWTFLGLIVQLYFVFSLILCIIFILRLFWRDENRVKSLLKNDTREERNEKAKFIGFFYVQSIIFVAIFVILSVSFLGYFVPYELQTYQSDYGSASVRYLASTLSYSLVLVATLKAWNGQWNSQSHIDILIRIVDYENKNK